MFSIVDLEEAVVIQDISEQWYWQRVEELKLQGKCDIVLILVVAHNGNGQVCCSSLKGGLNTAYIR
jgi:hypothetical protein